MRKLVVCKSCCRRYDASGRPAGARFRCLCGESLKVGAPRGHDASVVRCSSCGAPREKNADDCGHCGSDFTLHERDLHTVCPCCLARVSDKGRYCHYCAAPLIAEKLPSEKKDLRCPACERSRHLSSRRFEGFPISVLECQLCAGLWLGLESLEELLAAEARESKKVVGTSHPTHLEKLPARRGYIPCLVCGDLMSRRNLGQGKSGIVVDVCGHHGVWFDTTELARLVAWVRTGGLEEVRHDLARLVGSRDTVRKQHIAARTKKSPHSSGSSTRSGGGLGTDDRDTNWVAVAGQLAAEVLFRLF